MRYDTQEMKREKEVLELIERATGFDDAVCEINKDNVLILRSRGRASTIQLDSPFLLDKSLAVAISRSLVSYLHIDYSEKYIQAIKDIIYDKDKE